MDKGFTLHIDAPANEFDKQISKIYSENHNSLDGIKEIEVVLYDDNNIKTGINETTGHPFSYVGAEKVLELATFYTEANEQGTKLVFVGRPNLEQYVFKFAPRE